MWLTAVWGDFIVKQMTMVDDIKFDFSSIIFIIIIPGRSAWT